MFNSPVLEVVIGLVFIYLLYSLLVTTIQEIIATRFSFRAKILERAIFRMLEDENKLQPRIKGVFDLFRNKKNNNGDINTTSESFYEHPLMKFLGESKLNSKPAYIDKETFSKVIIDLLRGDQVKPGDDIKLLIQKTLDAKTIVWGKKINVRINDETLSYINSIWADAQGDIGKFKKYLENWFDETMDRATGWYKRHIQFVLFFIGLAIAIIFNVDTIKIVTKLEKDPKLREQIILQADAFVKAHPNLDTELLVLKARSDTLQAQIARKNMTRAGMDSLQKVKSEDSSHLAKYLAMKAETDTLINRADSLITTDLKKTNDILGLGWKTEKTKSYNFGSFLMSILGWIITATALSLGAPFWFDLLNKMMKLRGSVATPTSDDKEKKQA